MLLQLHLQLQDERRNIYDWGFAASYARGLTAADFHPWTLVACHIPPHYWPMCDPSRHVETVGQDEAYTAKLTGQVQRQHQEGDGETQHHLVVPEIKPHPSWLLATLRPRQNGRHFADNIFKFIFFHENAWILLKISLKFVPNVRINNIPALVQIMAWRRKGDKPLSEPVMISLLTYICVTRPQWVTHCSLVMPYGVIELTLLNTGSRVAWRHQAITWTNVN